MKGIRVRIIVALAGAAAIVGMLHFIGRTAAVEGPERTAPAGAGPLLPLSAADEPDGGENEAIADDPLVRRFLVERAPLIRDVQVEKSVVCMGEEVLVRVTGANPGGRDAHLLYRVAGRPGDRAVLRFARPGTKQITVVAGDLGTKIDMRTVSVEVAECAAGPVPVITIHPASANPDEIAFTVATAPGAPASRYRWDFGDGTRLETTEPRAVHNYFGRDQRSLSSSFLVTVDRGDAAARTVVTLANVHFLAGEMGTPLLPVMADRFASRRGDDLVAAVTVKNIRDGDIALTPAAITAYRADGGEETLAAPQAAALLSLPVVPGGALRSGRLTVPRGLLPAGTEALQVRLQGVTARGETVTALCQITVPPEAGGRPAPGDLPVTDPETIGRLERARSGMKTGHPVTVEELAARETAGRP